MSRAVYVYANLEKDAYSSVSRKVTGILLRNGYDVYAGNVSVVRDVFDFAVILGGDGTVLSALYAANLYGVPLCCINLGTLGFLLEQDADDLEGYFSRIFQGKYQIEERSMMKISLLQQGRSPVFVGYALNDMSVSRSTLGGVMRCNVYVDESFVSEYAADGVLVATPTGSTAYSLSAGGPIVDPDVGCFLITPVCAHSLYSRPLVVKDKGSIVIEPHRGSISLVLDGQREFPVETGQKVLVEKADVLARFLRVKDQDFFGLLQKKLGEWNVPNQE